MESFTSIAGTDPEFKKKGGGGGAHSESIVCA